MFLSLIPLSCIVVPKRELANTFFSLNLSLLSNSLTHNNMNMNMKIDTPKDWFNISNTNSCKKLLVNLSALSILYVERILALNNSFFQIEQVEHTKFQRFSLSYVFLKVGDTSRANKTAVTANIPKPQEEHINYKILKQYQFLIQSTNQTKVNYKVLKYHQFLILLINQWI